MQTAAQDKPKDVVTDMFTWDEFIKSDPSKRRQMWAQLRGDLPEEAEYWEDGEGCNEDIACQHFKNGWCSCAELPAGVNPYLTPRTGMLGMACMGLRPPQQIELNFR
jgi:hypothetical protein